MRAVLAVHKHSNRKCLPARSCPTLPTFPLLSLCRAPEETRIRSSWDCEFIVQRADRSIPPWLHTYTCLLEELFKPGLAQIGIETPLQPFVFSGQERNGRIGVFIQIR